MNVRENVASLLSFFLLLQLLNKSNAVDGPCIYDSNPRGIIDLTSVGRMHGTPRWKNVNPDVSDDHVYSYNPCYSFSQSQECVDAASCQSYAPDQSLVYSLGTQNSIQWLPNGDDPPAINYMAGERKLHVNLRCLQSGEPDSLQVHGYDVSVRMYIMVLSSKCACWNGCTSGPDPGPPGPDPGPKPGGLSGGAIVMIISLVLIVVYVGGFMAFNKYQRQATGLDILPHRSFWTSLPGLVLGGARFTFQKATGKS